MCLPLLLGFVFPQINPSLCDVVQLRLVTWFYIVLWGVFVLTDLSPFEQTRNNCHQNTFGAFKVN